MQRFPCGVLLGLAVLAAGPAPARESPGRPITLIVPSAAGGTTDRVARLVAQSMARTLGQEVLVENVDGAGGTRGAARAAQAARDGHTLLLSHLGQAAAPALYRQLPYDPVRDFEPIGEVADVPMALLGRRDLPARDIGELRAYIHANKSKVLLVNAGIGTGSHLCGLLFQSVIGAQLTALPYDGAGTAMSDLANGLVELMCEQVPDTTRALGSGAVRAYGVTTRSRVPSLPDVAPLDGAGLPGFEVVVWHGLYAPRGTPRPVVRRLVAALQAALGDPEVKARLAELGATPVPPRRGRPAALRQRLRSEMDRWQPIITRARAQVN